MIDSSKLSFVKKKLKEQGTCDLLTKNYSEADTFLNDGSFYYSITFKK